MHSVHSACSCRYYTRRPTGTGHTQHCQTTVHSTCSYQYYTRRPVGTQVTLHAVRQQGHHNRFTLNIQYRTPPVVCTNLKEAMCQSPHSGNTTSTIVLTCMYIAPTSVLTTTEGTKWPSTHNTEPRLHPWAVHTNMYSVQPCIYTYSIWYRTLISVVYSPSVSISRHWSRCEEFLCVLYCVVCFQTSLPDT